MEITADAVLDSDRDGSLLDEVTLGASGDAFSVTSQQLTDLSVTAVTNQSDSTVDITVTLAAVSTTIPEDRTFNLISNHLVSAAEMLLLQQLLKVLLLLLLLMQQVTQLHLTVRLLHSQMLLLRTQKQLLLALQT